MTLHDVLFWMQWPGLVTGLAGAWLVSGTTNRKRFWGFLLWVLSDIFWTMFGCATGGWGLILTQLVFCCTSSRGMWNNRK